MTPQYPRPRHHRSGLVLGGAILLAVATASCSATVLPVATLWSADVHALTPAGVSGRVGVVSQSGETRASMQVNTGVPGATYKWRMSEGDCTSEGNTVAGKAAYPVLNVGASGTAESEARLAGELSSGGSYAARILQDSGTGAEQVLACGALTQTK